MDSTKMSSRKQESKSSDTYLSAGTDIYLFSIKQYVLPCIISYYADAYGVEGVTAEELADEALKIKLPLDHKTSITPTKETNRKPKIIDTVGGCQYILEKSRTRQGKVCGDKRDLPGHFCKTCQGKATFVSKIQPYLDRTGLKFEEVTGPNYVPYVTKQANRSTAKVPPAKRGPKANAPVSKPRYKSRGKVEESDEDDTEDDDYDNYEAEKDLKIDGVTIDDLEDILYEPKSNIVFLMPPDNPEDIIAIGQWTEDGKISKLTEPLKITATKYGMTIGKYQDYDLGKYNVNYVEKKEEKKEESVKEEEEEEEKPKRLQPEERLHAIPNRRSIRRK